MTNITATLLCQLVRKPNADSAAWALHAMTGCTIMTDTAKVHLVFKRQVGAAKMTHLVVAYNEATDLYDLKGHRLNKRSGACPEVWSLSGVYADSLKQVAEEATGLYFTL